ncbi:MAG: carbohydrate ABC transporter permease [Firmicutes bacterium]|mgnify:CR=1 FL=1|nr:carbohydrate ABC transporter permease [Bacillota bacterium]
MKYTWKDWKWTLIALIPVLILIIPIYFVLISGFETVEEIYHQPPYLVPPNPTLQYYADAWTTLNHYLMNSVVISVGVLILTIVVAAPAAFALAKLNLRGEKTVSFLMALVQMLPVTTVVIPLFLIFFKLKLINTHVGVILGISAFTIPFSVILLTAYMRSMPWGLIEAARIDGASLFTIFVRIVMPICKPALSTAGMLALLNAWGDFIFAISFLQERSLQPMSVGLYSFIGQYGTQWNLLMAGSMIYSLPVIIVVTLAGKGLVSGLTAGAFKE